MKAQHTLLLTGAGLVALLSAVFAQPGGDPTTPPAGVPGKVMKTLDEVEARTPLVDGATGVSLGANDGFIISESGSYYLTGNLEVASGDAITVIESHVTIDLNGYKISASAPAGAAFRIQDGPIGGSNLGANMGVKITNGHIYSPYTVSGGSVIGNGFNYAISAVTGSRIIKTDMNIVGCDNGFALGERPILVQSVIVDYSGGTGIEADSVVSSRAENCEFDGIVAHTVTNSYGSSRFETGIAAEGSVTGSTGLSNDSTDSPGIAAKSVKDSYGYSVTGNGIEADLVIDSRGESSSADGIQAKLVRGSIGTSVTGHGIEADSVTDSRGSTNETSGIKATIAINSLGETQDINPNSGGIIASVVSSSSGTAAAGAGISAETVANSTGESANNWGINSKLVQASVGKTSGTTIGIRASSGVVSYSSGETSGSEGIGPISATIINSVGN